MPAESPATHLHVHVYVTATGYLLLSPGFPGTFLCPALEPSISLLKFEQYSTDAGSIIYQGAPRHVEIRSMGQSYMHVPRSDPFVVSAQPPVFVSEQMLDVIGKNGSSVTLDCSASGVPAVTYTWYMNSTKASEQLQITNTTSGKLVLENLSKNHSGMYQCQAGNEHGEIWRSWQVGFRFGK